MIVGKSKPSSASVEMNGMAKTDWPPVFSCTKLPRAAGAFRLAANRIRNQLPEVFTARGASVISSTFPAAFLIASSLRVSG